nr:hypothetical protein [Tanacetum cinerariifolium]
MEPKTNPGNKKRKTAAQGKSSSQPPPVSSLARPSQGIMIRDSPSTNTRSLRLQVSSQYVVAKKAGKAEANLSLQALSNFHYLFSGFMDYLWSRQLDISNFGPADCWKADSWSSPQIHFLFFWVSTVKDFEIFEKPSIVTGGRLGRSSAKTFGNSLTTGYEAQLGLTLITSDDQSFTVDRNVDEFFITENFGMILGQPVHTNNDIETTEFNRHEINFERHDKSLTLDTSFTQEKVSDIPMVLSWGDGISSDGFLPSILLLVVIIDAVVIVAVIVIVVVVGEGSPIIKLSFMIIDSLHRIVLYYLIY